MNVQSFEFFTKNDLYPKKPNRTLKRLIFDFEELVKLRNAYYLDNEEVALPVVKNSGGKHIVVWENDRNRYACAEKRCEQKDEALLKFYEPNYFVDSVLILGINLKKYCIVEQKTSTNNEKCNSIIKPLSEYVFSNDLNILNAEKYKNLVILDSFKNIEEQGLSPMQVSLFLSAFLAYKPRTLAEERFKEDVFKQLYVERVPYCCDKTDIAWYKLVDNFKSVVRTKNLQSENAYEAFKKVDIDNAKKVLYMSVPEINNVQAACQGRIRSNQTQLSLDTFQNILYKI